MIFIFRVNIYSVVIIMFAFAIILIHLAIGYTGMVVTLIVTRNVKEAQLSLRMVMRSVMWMTDYGL